jgi:hypothetical protein
MLAIRVGLAILILEALASPLNGQVGGISFENEVDEEIFKASTKQVNQFFRRFNGEEDPEGRRYFPTDRKYRDQKVRKEYLPLLVDPSVYADRPTIIRSFSDFINDKKNPVYLDNHVDNWFAEVNCQFLWNGKSSGITLFMRLQPQGEGYEWIIEDVSNSTLNSLFDKDQSINKPFLHPMSHELDFMNLEKAFRGDSNPESFTNDDFVPDYLSIFLYELKNKRLEFKTVQSVRFHFFSVPGWYFELSEYNRTGTPSGWLISNLVEAHEDQKSQIRQYIYGH